ncbi:MAG TPA: hypothetical protein VJH96_00460 [Patescibacteria group bacterium]|nr:hypothetical protein [Patescibacteria group bacterium]
MNKIHKKGLSIIETIIVIAIIAISILTLFSIFFSVLQARAKVHALQSLKEQVDVSLNVMKNLMRQRGSAIYSDVGMTAVNEVCGTNMSPPDHSATNPQDPSTSINLYFKDTTNPQEVIYFRLYNHPSGVAGTYRLSYLADGIYDLTNEDVQVTEFKISCRRLSALSPPFIAFSMKAKIGSSYGPSAQEDKDVLSFYTGVKLRN